MRLIIIVAIFTLLSPSVWAQGTAYEDTLSGKKCNEMKTLQQIGCVYKVGEDLEFSIDGIGTPDTGITFTRSNIKGDYYASFGLMHGCILVMHGKKRPDLFLKPDFAFVSPLNGKVYKTGDACKAGY